MVQHLHITYAQPPENFKSSLDDLQNLIQCQLPECCKFKFCCLELSEISLPNIFNPQLIEFANAELAETESQLYFS